MTKEKRFRIGGVVIVFWKEQHTLWCKVEEMGADIYCCGDAKMPRTKKQALALTERAWLW